MDDKKLIELVRKEKFLYDSSDPYYNDFKVKMEKWKEIGLILRRDPNRCKSRWESLRNQFRKYLRTSTGQSSGSLWKWRYYDNLSFLIPYMRNPGPRYPLVLKEQEDAVISAEAGGIEKSEEESEEEISNFPYDLNNSKRDEREIDEMANSDFMMDDRKIRKRHEERSEDDIDLFFDAMRATVKKFSEKNRILAKRRVFDIIFELEQATLNEMQRDTQTLHNSIDEDAIEIKPVCHIFPSSSTPTSNF